jgi:hypothetical protein
MPAKLEVDRPPPQVPEPQSSVTMAKPVVVSESHNIQGMLLHTHSQETGVSLEFTISSQKKMLPD